MGGCLSSGGGGSSSSKRRSNALDDEFKLPPKPNHVIPDFGNERTFASFSEPDEHEATHGVSPGFPDSDGYKDNHFEGTKITSELKKVGSVKLKEFEMAELQDATNNFDEDLILGEGAFGMVYKGFLEDQNSESDIPVAIKRLNPECFNGQEQWLSEILILGKLRHPHLVRLLGYCSEKEDSFLVYEFLAQGSLDYHIYPSDEPTEGDRPSVARVGLPWQTRVKIALHCALGVGFLHENGVIHRDLKSSNVLLDDDYNAVVTDFGLSREGPGGTKTHVSTAVMGTLGYLDPRYAESGHLTQKSDVYAFGVILLELITGKKAMFKQENGKMFPLSNWARQKFSKLQNSELHQIMDPLLETRFPDKTFQILAILAKHCISYDVQDRPTMDEIVKALKPLV